MTTQVMLTWFGSRWKRWVIAMVAVLPMTVISPPTASQAAAATDLAASARCDTPTSITVTVTATDVTGDKWKKHDHGTLTFSPPSAWGTAPPQVPRDWKWNQSSNETTQVIATANFDGASLNVFTLDGTWVVGDANVSFTLAPFTVACRSPIPAFSALQPSVHCNSSTSFTVTVRASDLSGETYKKKARGTIFFVQNNGVSVGGPPWVWTWDQSSSNTTQVLLMMPSGYITNESSLDGIWSVGDPIIGESAAQFTVACANQTPSPTPTPTQSTTPTPSPTTSASASKPGMPNTGHA